MTPYSALALQMDCHAVNGLADRAAVEQAMSNTLDRVDQAIAGSKGFIGTFSGDTLRLVVLPEYFLTSFPMGESISCLLYTSPSPRDRQKSRMPSSA